MNAKNIHQRSHRAGTSRTALIVVLLAIFAAGLAAGTYWGAQLRGALGLARPGETAGEAAPPAGTGQLFTCGMHPQVIQDRPGTCPICGMALTPVAGTSAVQRAEGGERRVKYWWDPMMSPPYISDQPGVSPMGMDLVPVYEDEVSAGSTLLIDPTVVQNMGLRVARVEEAPLARTIRAVGILAEPEPARHDVNLRLGGWIDRLHADTEGMWLAKGDPLFDLYSPDLQVAIEELIGARRMGESPGSQSQADAVSESAARKLELYGLAREQVDELAALETAPHTVTFRSPAEGYLVEKTVYAGSAVTAGDTVMRIADTSRLWLDSRVFEKDLPHVQLDQEATATVDGRPGEGFEGRVILVHPRIDPTTRTALVRMEIENPELRLRHGMFATAFLRVEIASRAIVVPREAIIDTGARQVAFVALDMGHFEPRKVEMGASGEEGMVQVLSGLAPGEQVVVSGQFLLDAESRMKEAIQRFLQQKSLPLGGSGSEVRVPQEPTAGVLEGVSEEWERAAEQALAAYLALARVLGQPQETDQPVGIAELMRTAQALRESAAGEDPNALADALVAAVAAMQGRAIEEQRKLFGAVSEAAIDLAQRSPRTGELAPRVLLASCPMVKARWLQDGEEIANPYYATTMKACGEIEREIPIPDAERAPPARSHPGDDR
ncbi:MAG TPA: efflux RND transporter periplasmic adaptor subunit [Planctomycetota bacterium]|nr:efflux RND transporter periplasmic adaptor subunit [Planctomycetota bacterium]